MPKQKKPAGFTGSQWERANIAAKSLGVCLSCEMQATKPGEHTGCVDGPNPETSKGLFQMIPSKW